MFLLCSMKRALGKIAEKVQSVGLSAELIKMHSFRLLFWGFCPLGGAWKINSVLYNAYQSLKCVSWSKMQNDDVLQQKIS